MTVKEIKDHFKKETGQEIFKTILFINQKDTEAITHNPEYVKWLENKLAHFLTS